MNFDTIPFKDLAGTIQNNERMLEMKFARHFIDTCKNIIEIGAVSCYYWEDGQHPIYDPTDKHKASINKDAESIDFSGKSVLSISTFEHIGVAQYGLKAESEKGPRIFSRLHEEADRYLVSFPVAQNPAWDNWIKTAQYHWIGFIRTSLNPPVWVRLDDYSIFTYHYGKPYPNGNAVVFLTKNYGI